MKRIILMLILVSAVLVGCNKKQDEEFPVFEQPNISTSENEQKDKENENNPDAKKEDETNKEEKEEEKEESEEIKDEKDSQKYDEANVFLTVVVEAYNQLINDHWNVIVDEISKKTDMDYTIQIQKLDKLKDLIAKTKTYISDEKIEDISDTDKEVVAKFKEHMLLSIDAFERCTDNVKTMCESKNVDLKTTEADMNILKDELVKALELIK